MVHSRFTLRCPGKYDAIVVGHGASGLSPRVPAHDLSEHNWPYQMKYRGFGNQKKLIESSHHLQRVAPYIGGGDPPIRDRRISRRRCAQSDEMVEDLAALTNEPGMTTVFGVCRSPALSPR
jgi:hypothetical protein